MLFSFCFMEREYVYIEREKNRTERNWEVRVLVIKNIICYSVVVEEGL